jgi:uncharacterized RDD family membrane protein YckC
MPLEEKPMPYCKNCGNKISGDAAYCPTCGKLVQTPTQLTLATWGERIIAWIIDIIILSIILAPINFFLTITWPGYHIIPWFPRWVPFVDFGASNLVHFLYWTIAEGAYGQSVGKIIMRTKLTDLDGKHAGPARAAIESVGKAFLLPIDLILGLILHARKRQRIFNYLSGTIVVRT